MNKNFGAYRSEYERCTQELEAASRKRAIARLVKCKPDEAEARAPEFVTKLKDALALATGAAPMGRFSYSYCTMGQYIIYKHCSLMQYIECISCIEMQSHEIELL